MSLIKNAYKKLLKEDFENDGFYVYHGTALSAITGIAAAGFERIYTNSNGGNMYGAGVYTTYRLAKGFQNTNGFYGSAMLKSKVKSLASFVIYEKDIAEKVYGTRISNNIEEQFKKIFTDEEFKELRNSRYIDYDKAINSRGEMYSSRSAVHLANNLQYYHPRLYYKINGYVFFGSNDGYVCLVNDFKNLYPVEVSKDGGNSWQKIPNTKTFKDFCLDDADLKWVLGKLNYDLYKQLDFCPYNYTKGFARIISNGKCNYLYRKRHLKDGPISKIWFDEGPETFNQKGNAVVQLNGESFILHLDAKENKFYVYYKDGKYLCELDKFPMFVNSFMNSSISDDEEDDF